MARTARSIVGGCCYHFLNRGNNKARVFHEASDFDHFLDLVARAQRRVSLALLAACVMPNHVHFVVRPDDDDAMSRWAHWLFTTHVKHHHLKYGTVGRVWQGRFKAFAIQKDGHLLTVMRYVERNALRSGLVSAAEDWRWGSLHWRVGLQTKLPLAPSPIRLPDNWCAYVNEPQSLEELDAIRTAVNRQRPYGSSSWVLRKARALSLEQTLRPPGRPKQGRVAARAPHDRSGGPPRRNHD